MSDTSLLTPYITEQFMSAMGLGGLDEAQKEQALQTAITAINLTVGPRVLGQLSEKQLEQLEELTNKPANDEEIDQWLTQNVTNLHRILEEEARKMRDEAVSDVNNAMDARA